jgi:hypothetical protein
MTVELAPSNQNLPARDPHGARDRGDDAVTAAARHLYEAELALHDAHQSRVDAWIAAAGDRLHDAAVEYLHELATNTAEDTAAERRTPPHLT